MSENLLGTYEMGIFALGSIQEKKVHYVQAATFLDAISYDFPEEERITLDDFCVIIHRDAFPESSIKARLRISQTWHVVLTIAKDQHYIK